MKIRFPVRADCRVRGLWVSWRLRAIGGHVGRRLWVDRGVQIITARGAHWQIGDRVTLAAGVIVTVDRGASLTIGDGARIMHYTVIGVAESVSIGARAQVAEHCSIRDHDHDVAAPSMLAAPVVQAPVSVGADAWIGRGAVVLRGCAVGAGAVVGANAVVRADVPPGAVAVGVPARVVRSRRERRP